MQQGQVFAKGNGSGDATNWAYRYRLGGENSKRVQRSGFPTETAAAQALDRALERARQEQGLVETPTLNELVEMYLAQHDTEPETIEKLRWLLSKATARFGNTPISELAPAEIAAWRMTIPYGHRFEATQALRQTLARAVSWGMLNTNPAKQGVTNRQRPRIEQHPFESWDELNGSRGPARTAARAARPVRRRDRAATKRMARPRTARHRPPRTRRLRPPRLPQRPDQMPEDRRQPPRRPAPTGRARSARRPTQTQRVSARIPRPARRLPRPAQLPLPRLETRPARPRDRPDQKDLRSQAFLRHVRAPRRHLDLRPLPLHGRQPDDDRPPLRPPRQRRPPARNQPPRHPQRRRNATHVHTVDAKWTRKKGSRPTTGQKNRL